VYLTRKGVYTPETRRLVRELVGLGCAVTSVADLLSCCARAWNVKLVGRVSARTVARAVEEGGVAAKMQIGDVINKSDGELHSILSQRIFHITNSRNYN